jgi:hypothetical protein
MKTIITQLFLVFVTGMSYAQTDHLPQPDFINVPAAYLEEKNALLSLQKETVNIVGKVGKAVYDLPGTASMVRIKSGDKISFLIKAGDYDPSTFTTFYKMKVTKKARQAVMETGLISVNMNSEDAVQFVLEKADEHLFRFKFAQKLEPGEYMFYVGGVPYTFGMD